MHKVIELLFHHQQELETGKRTFAFQGSQICDYLPRNIQNFVESLFISKPMYIKVKNSKYDFRHGQHFFVRCRAFLLGTSKER